MSQDFSEFDNAITWHNFKNKIFMIIEDRPLPVVRNIQTLVERLVEIDLCPDIFLELPYERKRSPYTQSWLQYLYSEDFTLAERLGFLRYLFPADYDRGLKSFYKKVKSCASRYKDKGKSKYDKICPFDKCVKVHMMDIFQQKKATCPSKKDDETTIFNNFINVIKNIRSGSDKGVIEFVQSIDGLSTVLNNCLKIDTTLEMENLMQKLINACEIEYKAYNIRPPNESLDEYDDKLQKRMESMKKYLENISDILINFYALSKAVKSKNEVIIFYTTTERADDIRDIIRSLTLSPTPSTPSGPRYLTPVPAPTSSTPTDPVTQWINRINSLK